MQLFVKLPLVKNAPLRLPALQPYAAGDFPSAAEVCALRAWYEGLSSLEAVERYLSAAKADGESSRKIVGNIRKRLVSFAKSRHQTDFVKVFTHRDTDRAKVGRAAIRAIEVLKNLPVPVPTIGDDVVREATTRLF